MGKLTSMHFAGWKMGLKTGMYYLRTMAASAPIQFTVDQEQLLVEDTNIARSKKRTGAAGASVYSAIPRTNGAEPAIAKAVAPVEETPRSVAAPAVSAPTAVETDEVAEAEPEDAESRAKEGDIFSDAVLQCSIENKDACIMCQG